MKRSEGLLEAMAELKGAGSDAQTLALLEIAFQLAVMNERNAEKTNAEKLLASIGGGLLG